MVDVKKGLLESKSRVRWVLCCYFSESHIMVVVILFSKLNVVLFRVENEMIYGLEVTEQYLLMSTFDSPILLQWPRTA